MSREEQNRVAYIVMCMFRFAARHGMDVRDAVACLVDRGGIAHLDRHYDIEHTLPLEDTLDTLDAVCRRNGAVLA